MIKRRECSKIRAPESIIGDYEYVCDGMLIWVGFLRDFLKGIKKTKSLIIMLFCGGAGSK